jgi:hypothetical protein
LSSVDCSVIGYRGEGKKDREDKEDRGDKEDKEEIFLPITPSSHHPISP